MRSDFSRNNINSIHVDASRAFYFIFLNEQREGGCAARFSLLFSFP